MRGPFPELEPEEAPGPAKGRWGVAARRLLLLARGPGGPRSWGDWGREAALGLALVLVFALGVAVAGYLEHALMPCAGVRDCLPGSRLFWILSVQAGLVMFTGFLYLAFICLPMLALRVWVWRLWQSWQG